MNFNINYGRLTDLTSHGMLCFLNHDFRYYCTAIITTVGNCICFVYLCHILEFLKVPVFKRSCVKVSLSLQIFLKREYEVFSVILILNYKIKVFFYVLCVQVNLYNNRLNIAACK